MTTRTLKKHRKKSRRKPAVAAMKLRRWTWYVLALFLVPATASVVLIIAGIWVPGMAWLN